jgi:feruloyl esterase
MVTIAKTLYPDPSQLSSNVLTKATLQKLSDAIIAQCDEQDGLKDGIIQDPAAAHFDLSKVEGLTDEQRKAIETIFHGARDIKGANYPGFFPVAECSTDQWIAWITGPVAPLLIKDHAPDLTFAFGTQIFKYLIFNQADWNYATYDFSNYEQDARLAASYLNATNPDLSGLKARKGRLIIWHGWADTALPAQGTIDYYREVLARDSQAADYCRLFMVPGCLHCGGGPGAAEVDWLAVIVDWVEKSKAPDHLIVSKHEGGKLALTRPLYPYPGVARFKGTGDPNKAESFELRK